MNSYTDLQIIYDLRRSLGILRQRYKEGTSYEKFEILAIGKETRKKLNRRIGVYKKRCKEKLTQSWQKDIIDILF